MKRLARELHVKKPWSAPLRIPTMRKVVTMTVTLETLEMTPEELECGRDAVQKMAYFNWLDSGCPDSGPLEFWLQAERQWIESNYVPRRTLEATRPQQNDAANCRDRSESRQAKSRRRRPAAAAR